MNVSPVVSVGSVQASVVVRPPRSRSNKTPISNAVCVRPTSRRSQGRLFPALLALVVFPASVSAAPPTFGPRAHIAIGIYPRQSQGPQNNNPPPSNGSISMSVWLPILLVTVVFVLFSFVTCVRRCAALDAVSSTSTAGNRAATTTTNGNTTRPRRRPRRTPSQISTKSLPPYMKEPGDQELVLFRGPSEMEDDTAPPQPMPTLTEDDDEHQEMRGATFGISLNRLESMETMPDSSTTNLIRRDPASGLNLPELHHTAVPRRSGDAHSLDSVGSEAELLVAHQRSLSVDSSALPRGEAPSYTESASAEGGMTIISLNDPEPNHVSSNGAVPPSLEAARGRSRFSFLMRNPFGSHNHTSSPSSNPNANQSSTSVLSESPARHMRNGSALSRFSTRESHETHHSRSASGNNNLTRSRSRSNSHLFRAFRSHSPGLHAGSSTISLDSISAPLTHTATRAEFHAPKGGLLTAEQIKLITSREALEKFGMPYGPDAVAAFSMSKERLAELGPPPDFESVAGEHPERSGASDSGFSTTEATAQRSETSASDTALPCSPSPSPSPSQPSPSRRVVERAESRTSTVTSFTTAPEPEMDASGAQAVQMYAPGGENEVDEADEPRTARPMTPRTARPSGPYGGHERPW